MPDADKYNYHATSITEIDEPGIYRVYTREFVPDAEQIAKNSRKINMNDLGGLDAFIQGQVKANALMQEVDLLIAPTVPAASPVLQKEDPESGRQRLMYTRPFNLLGLPVIQIPAGFCPAGLPWGFQLVGHPFQEALLLRLAHHFMAQTTAWRRLPVL